MHSRFRRLMNSAADLVEDVHRRARRRRGHRRWNLIVSPVETTDPVAEAGTSDRGCAPILTARDPAGLASAVASPPGRRGSGRLARNRSGTARRRSSTWPARWPAATTDVRALWFSRHDHRRGHCRPARHRRRQAGPGRILRRFARRPRARCGCSPDSARSTARWHKQLYRRIRCSPRRWTRSTSWSVDEAGYSIKEMILDDSQDYEFETSQVGIFTIQIGLAAMLRAHGAEPTPSSDTRWAR